ncbi:MAG TPA: lipocalin family protein [Kiritimatiellia bacterium]|nr:lipocalin family protein [Kiritimatiellia bacterium]HPR68310.1 lipocalin family protein [Kiritimatiellia bacterium]HRX06182.1 lipocalin family protein [Kiritimatiellia bacterium]
MKWMQWMLALALAAGMGLAGLGCDDDDSSSDRDPLVGTWTAQSFNGQELPDNVSLTITFRSNGEYVSTTTIDGMSETESGTWSAENGVLTTVSGGETDTIAYALNRDTLTVSDDGETFVLTR